MPAHQNYYQPDAIDVNTMVTAIGTDFGLLCKLEAEFGRDKVVVFARCVHLVRKEGDVVEVQAMVARPLKPAPNIAVMMYSAALDCWHQLDRGMLAAATAPVQRGWNGRPRKPERSAR
jgi:hypothetical protein